MGYFTINTAKYQLQPPMSTFHVSTLCLPAFLHVSLPCLVCCLYYYSALHCHLHTKILKTMFGFVCFVMDPARLSCIRTRSEHIGNFESLTPNSHGTSGIGWNVHMDHCLAWWATSLSAGDCRPCSVYNIVSYHHDAPKVWKTDTLSIIKALHWI